MSKMNAWLGEIMKAGNGKIIGIVLTSGLRCLKMYTVKLCKTTGVQTGCSTANLKD